MGAQPSGWANQFDSSNSLKAAKLVLAMVQTLTGIRLRPQGDVWPQSHTWTVPLLQPPLPVFVLLCTVPAPRQGQILLPQVTTSIRGSQINISYDLRSLQEQHAGEW